MNITDNNIELCRPVTERVFQVRTHVLSHPLYYGVKSIRQFALSIGMGSQNMYALEDGSKRNVTLVNVLKLCHTYGVSADWLLLGHGEMLLKPATKKATTTTKKQPESTTTEK